MESGSAESTNSLLNVNDKYSAVSSAKPKVLHPKLSLNML